MEINNVFTYNETECPICLEKSFLNIYPQKEFVYCNNCDKQFFIIKCYLCLNYIYFEKKIFISGFNIQCPYKKCPGKIYSQNLCIKNCLKCSKPSFLRSYYVQGDLFICFNCKENDLSVKCPLLNCEKYIKVDSSYREGDILKCSHNNKNFSFQIINCYYCHKNLIYDNNIGKKYYMGQTIICAYNDCKYKYNKIYCLKCNKLIILNGSYTYGSKLNCSNCSSNFYLFLCPFCFKINNVNEFKNLEGRDLKCNYCHKRFVFLICLLCYNINYYDLENKKYYEGQLISCSNEKCKKRYSKIKCPKCEKNKNFINEVPILGKEYICSDNNCKQSFYLYYCLKCDMMNVQKKERSKLSYCSNCNKKMYSLQCPFCYKFYVPNDLNDINLKTHSFMVCDYCNKKFFYYICPFCDKDFTYFEFKKTNIICPNKYCKKIYSMFLCLYCNNENFSLDKINESNLDSKKENCKFCKKENNIDLNDNSYFNDRIINFKPIKFYRNKFISIHQPSVCEYDIEIQKNLIWTSLYDKKPIQIIDEETAKRLQKKAKNYCVVCLTNECESVFAPCGHKCVCLECGKNIWENVKKCPVCREKLTDFLEKVIDV